MIKQPGSCASSAVFSSSVTVQTHTQKLGYITETHVCWNIQLALECIVVEDELFQIDEVAELFGQYSFKTSDIVSKINTCMLGHTSLTVEAHAPQAEPLELGDDCHIRCNGPTQLAAAQIELFGFCEGRK